jgi:glycerate dehydrogenase
MKIVLLDAQTLDHHDIDWSLLNVLGDLVFYDFTGRDEYAKRVAEADILIVNKFIVDQDVINAAPNLKYICVAATGYNNLHLDVLKSHGIAASNVRGYSSTGVAQHVFSFILNHYNRTQYYAEEVFKGRWLNTRDFCFYDHSIEELAGKTLGIIGFGNIGKCVAKIADAYGMNVVVHSSYEVPDEFSYVQNIGLDELLSHSDIITLHCPLTATTTGMINEVSLTKMKPNGILINTGRGPLINENDLAHFLKNNPQFTAMLDVLSAEPPSDMNPLLGLNNCIITPHIAWASKQARQRLVNGLAENIKAFQAGNPVNLVC